VNKRIRLSCISDIHLGNRRNKAKEIISNLDKYFSNDEHLSKVDLVVLAGDVFDDILSLSADDVPYIKQWVARLLRLCYKYGIIIRVLEGTPSHDRKQSEMFSTINLIHDLNSSTGVNLKHVTEIGIEFIPEFGINVLYVPDEANPTTEETLDKVKALLVEHGLNQVDFAFMHGNFEYQLPSHIKNIPRHSSDEYMAIVRYLIFIGHIHIHTRNDRILAQGSFDRLGHNEEGPKGFLHAIVQPSGDHEIAFIENVTAKQFITVNCCYDEAEENIKLIDRAVDKLPAASNVRLEAMKGNAMLANVDAMRVRWPLLVWTAIARDKDEEDSPVVMAEESLYVPITIDKHNLLELVMGRLAKLNLEERVLKKCALNLSEMQRI
jgi:UDP-2,3-diacylglucosamine pyrophosphatase LpxH